MLNSVVDIRDRKSCVQKNTQRSSPECNTERQRGRKYERKGQIVNIEKVEKPFDLYVLREQNSILIHENRSRKSRHRREWP